VRHAQAACPRLPIVLASVCFVPTIIAITPRGPLLITTSLISFPKRSHKSIG
jgi:hypothetical protein